MAVRLDPEQEPTGLEPGRHLAGHLEGALALECSVTGQIAAELVDRLDDRQSLGAGQVEVLLAAAGCDVDEARALGLLHVTPQDDPVGVGRGGREIVEGRVVLQVLQLPSGTDGQDLNRGEVRGQDLQACLGHVVDAVVEPNAGVGEIRVDGHRHVGR